MNGLEGKNDWSILKQWDNHADTDWYGGYKRSKVETIYLFIYYTI